MPINRGGPHLAKTLPNQPRVESFQSIVKSSSINKSSFLPSVLLCVLSFPLYSKLGNGKADLATSKGQVV